MHVRSRLVCLLISVSASMPLLAQSRYIYVANSTEATVSEIDIWDNKEVARFRTWTGSAAKQTYDHGSYQGAAPSRIAIDDDGNVYVLNRQWVKGTEKLPSLLKLRPPGSVSGPTSKEVGNDGFKLSNDSEVLPLDVIWEDKNKPFTHAVKSQSTIPDARVEWIVRIGESPKDDGGLGRSLCIDRKGFLWVGIHGSARYYKLNPANGERVATVDIPATTPAVHTPYGCVVDSNGMLWSASDARNLAQIDTEQNKFVPPLRDHSAFGRNYAISMKRGCERDTKVYLSDRDDGRTVIAFDRDPSVAQPFSNPQLIWQGSKYPPFAKSFSIAVDRDGNIISGNNAHQVDTAANLVKYTPDGTVLWETGTDTVKGLDLHGLILDAKNDIWAVHRQPIGADGKVVKYSGSTGKPVATVTVGREPYTYTNQPPQICPCAEIGRSEITCKSLVNGTGTYAFKVDFTNKNPFATAATAVDIQARPPMTGLAANVAPIPVPIHEQGIVSGTFSVPNAKAGDRVCFDMRLTGGPDREPWCCPKQEVCFTLPECRLCVQAEATVACRLDGTPYVDLQVRNGGPSASQSVQVFSTTPGVTVTPSSSTLILQPGETKSLELGISGATANKSVALTVNLHGPMNDQGVYAWCCTTNVGFVYPDSPCDWIGVGGEVYDDVNFNAIRDPGERGVDGWTVVLQPETGKARSMTTGAGGTFRFTDVPPGRYRVSLQPRLLWRTTAPASGAHDITVKRGGGHPPLTFAVTSQRLIDRLR